MQFRYFRKGLFTACTVLLAAGVAACTTPASADHANDISIRLGAFLPTKQAVSNLAGEAAFAIGLEYGFAKSRASSTGDFWQSRLSADIQYGKSDGGLYHNVPVSLSQVYVFHNETRPVAYMGASLSAATFGGSTNGFKQPTITRLGLGIVFGYYLSSHLFLEGRYERYNSNGTMVQPDGFRAYVGYKL